MLTLKRHRFAAAAATLAVTIIVALTTGSAGAGAPMNAMAETVSADTDATDQETARTIDHTKESQTGPGYVIDTRLKLSMVDAQAMREGNKLTGGLIQHAVQKQIEKEELLRQQAEENKREMGEQEKAAARAAMGCSEEDYNTLLRIVQAEAGVCDEKGKILVANVILNRVKSAKFPNTIRGVVYQANQFSPVSNGSINRVHVTEETIECVDRALAGEDYSQGALFFMNRGRSRKGAAGWFDRSLTYLFSHDGHEFFR